MTSRPTNGFRLVGALILSVVVHALLFALIGVDIVAEKARLESLVEPAVSEGFEVIEHIFETPEELSETEPADDDVEIDDPESDEPVEVDVATLEDLELEELEPDEFDPIELVEEEEEAEDEEEEEEEEADDDDEQHQDDELAQPDIDDRQAVYQPEDNNEVPETDDFFWAEVDNSAEVQTQAEDVTLFSEGDEPELAGEAEETPEDAGSEEEVLTEQVTTADDPEEFLSNADPLGNSDDLAGIAFEQEAREAQAARDAQAEQATALEQVEVIEVPLPEHEHGEHELVEAGAEHVDPLRQFTLGAAMDQMEDMLGGDDGGGDSMAAQVAQVASADYLAVLGDRDADDRERMEREARESSFLGDHQGDWERTRSALENFDIAVASGEETHLNTRASEFAPFIHLMHNRIHPRWWDRLTWYDLHHGPADEMSNVGLLTVLEFVIDQSGELEDVNIVRGSGVLMFDADALALAYDIAPFDPPPAGMLSSDGNAYVHWTFHRNGRACGTRWASIHRVGGSDDLDDGTTSDSDDDGG